METLVIIPTYCPQKYIFHCLDTLQNQTANPDHFNVVIILNGPKEPFYSGILDYLFENQLNYKLLYNEKIGVSAARNLGIEYAYLQGNKNIIFLDDDDLLSSNYIENMQKLNKDQHLVVSNTLSFISDTNSTFPDYLSDAFQINFNKPYSLFNCRSFLSNACGKLIPLDLIGTIRFHPQISIGEDSLFGFQISRNIEKMIFSDESTIYFRRVRENSASRYKRPRIKKVANSFRLWGKYTIYYLKSPFKYGFFFYLSRMVAVFIQIFK